MSSANSLDAEKSFTEPARDDILRLWRAFAPLDMSVRARVLRQGLISATARNDAFKANGEIGVVLAGCLLLRIDQSPLCAGVAGPGDLVDLGGGASGRWIASGEIYRTSLSAFLSEAGEAGVRFLLEGADRRRRAVETRLACAMAHNALSRVASVLLEMDAACQGVDVPLCQSDIADMLSLRRTSVNAACQSLRQAGAIRTVRGRTIITDRGALRAIACCPAAIKSVQSAEIADDAPVETTRRGAAAMASMEA